MPPHSQAPNYGGRVPVDSAPSPVPVYRALKKSPLSACQRSNSSTVPALTAPRACRTQQRARPPPCPRTGLQVHAQTFRGLGTQRVSQQVQLWEHDCLLHDGTRGTCTTSITGASITLSTSDRGISMVCTTMGNGLCATTGILTTCTTCILGR